VRVAQAPAARHPGYHGLLLEDGRADAVDVIADLCATRADFDALVFPDLPDTDEPTSALVRGLSSRRFAAVRAFRNPCRAVTLGVGYDEFLRTRKSGKSVKNLRRDERRVCEAGDVEVLHLVGPAVTPDAVRRAAAVQRASWMRRRGAAVLSGDFHERLALSAARAGLAHLWIASIDGDDAAFGFALLLHGRMHFVWTAFDLRFEKLSVGKTLVAWIIRDACAARVRTFDFGHGDAEYKRFWSSGAHHVDRVALGRGARGAAYVAACAAAWRLARVGWIRAAFRVLVP
jgi:CelD/BcsL family acetyltransferase involved in cellulose biosynthesis